MSFILLAGGEGVYKKVASAMQGIKERVMIFGYPNVEYKRIVPRKDLKFDKL